MQFTHHFKTAPKRVRAKARTATWLAQSRRALARAAGGGTLSPRSHASIAVKPDHLSFLDGSTLNLCLRVPDTSISKLILRVANEHRILGDFPMTVTSHGVEHRAELAIPVPASWGHASASSLDNPDTRHPHSDGIVAFKLHSDDGRTFDLLPPTPAHVGGPTVATPPRPDLGFALSLASGHRGRVFLRLTSTPPRADVIKTVIDWTRLSITGRVLGAPLDALTSATITLHPRNGNGTRRALVSYDGHQFRCDIPTSLLTDISGDEQVWDFRLPIDGGETLRLGRWLTDVRDPKAIYRQPGRILVSSDGRSVHGQIYYTPAGSLALRVNSFRQEVAA